MNLKRTATVARPATAVHWVTLERSRTVAAAILDRAGDIIRCNDLFRSLIADPDGRVSPNLSARLADGRTWETTLADCEAGSPVPIVLEATKPDGSIERLSGELIPSGIEGESDCLVGVFTPPVEPVSTQAMLSRNARLEALLCLTSGVAHDFNNLLTVLSGNLALAAEEVRARPETFRKLKSARDAAKRGGELIRQLLAFVRQKELGSERIEPVRVVESIAPLIERALGSRVRLVLELDESAGSIDASAVQLESAIVNLAVNARDAMDAGGEVRISVRPVAAADAIIGSAAIEVAVADDGPGIPERLLDKVRQPFFTTKGDAGTGLGLSMVDAFVRQHGGQLEIRTGAGRGTRILMQFPRQDRDASESIAATMPLLALPGGNETIVVVGRDESVLGTVEQILTVLGYQVFTATNMQQANQSIRNRDPRLIVSDGFDPGALLNACSSSSTASSCAALELVGQADPAATSALRGDTTTVWRILKPFSLPDLANAVRNALDGSA